MAFSSLPQPIHDFFEVADRICELYISSRERFVIMDNGNVFIPKRGGSPLKLSNRYVCHHLNHQYAIGIFAGNYSSKFICFDVDDGDKETVRKIITLVEQFGIPRNFVHVSTSGGKGYHVEVFFDDIVYTNKLAILYDYVIISGKLDARKVEFRPTHTQSIKLPLSVHYKTGNVCWFLNPSSFEPYPSSDYIFGIEKFPRGRFNELVTNCGLRNSITETNNPVLERITNSDAPKTKEITPEIEALISSSSYPRITAQGQRHFLMRSIAINNRVRGMSQEDSYKALEAWWYDQNKDHTNTPTKEALDDAASLVRWTFSDAFVPPTRNRKLVIDEDLLSFVLAQKLRITRKIAFLLACFSSAYGSLKMSHVRIAEYVGCSELSAYNTLCRMAEDGWIDIIRSGRVFRDGNFRQLPNTYKISNSAKEKVDAIISDKAKDMKLFTADFPITYGEDIRAVEETNEYTKICIPQLVAENFSDFYTETILSAVTPEALSTFLGKAELSRLKKAAA